MAVAAPATPSAASLVLAPCSLPGVEHPARCGVLSRPLDPSKPQGPSIGLHVAVLPASSRQAHADPVFFLAGGPGQSAIDLAGSAQRLLPRIGHRRNLVLVDQRGTGRSAPLRCADGDDPLQALAEAIEPERIVARLQRCRADLQALPHGDLHQYTTSIAAQDLDAVRQALGVARMNLVAVSYGTRLALEVLRQHPQTVRRAVLDGVSPPDQALPDSSGPDAQSALDALGRWCRADASCSARHPGLSARWAQVLASLPQTVTVPHPVSGRAETLTLSRGAAAALMRSALYAPALAAALPHAVEEAAQGRWAAWVGLAGALAGGRRGGVAQGLHFSVICSEDLAAGETAVAAVMPAAATAARPAAAGTERPAAAGTAGPATGDFGDTLSDLYRRVCADWPRGRVAPDFRRLPPAPAPVLLLSGGLDPVTPPRHAERVARSLGALARHWVVPQAGHGVAGLRCLRDAVQRFVDAPDDADALAVDGHCADALPRPPLFVPPGDGGRR